MLHRSPLSTIAALVAVATLSQAAQAADMVTIFKFYNYTPGPAWGVVQGERELEVPAGQAGNSDYGEHRSYRSIPIAGTHPRTYTVNFVKSPGSGDTYCDYTVHISPKGNFFGNPTVDECKVTVSKSGEDRYRCDTPYWVKHDHGMSCIVAFYLRRTN